MNIRQHSTERHRLENDSEMQRHLALKGPLLHEETIAGIRELDTDGDGLLAGLIAMFKDDTPPRLKALEEAVVTGDTNEAASLAHSLKSGSLGLGAQGLAMLCEDMEQAGRRGEAETLHNLCSQLQSLYSATCDELEKLLE